MADNLVLLEFKPKPSSKTACVHVCGAGRNVHQAMHSEHVALRGMGARSCTWYESVQGALCDMRACNGM